MEIVHSDCIVLMQDHGRVGMRAREIVCSRADKDFLAQFHRKRRPELDSPQSFTFFILEYQPVVGLLREKIRLPCGAVLHLERSGRNRDDGILCRGRHIFIDSGKFHLQSLDVHEERGLAGLDGQDYRGCSCRAVHLEHGSRAPDHAPRPGFRQIVRKCPALLGRKLFQCCRRTAYKPSVLEYIGGILNREDVSEQCSHRGKQSGFQHFPVIFLHRLDFTAPEQL